MEGVSKFTIIDAVVAYDCPYTRKKYLFLMRNVLYIASIKHNLITPLILREAILTVSDIPKIHCDETTIEDHSIYDEKTKLWIPIQLDGIFSYFPTRALTLDEMQNCDQIEHIFLSPDAETWDSYSESYSINEDQIIDAGGDMVYTTPIARTVFEQTEDEEISAILDENNTPVVRELSAIPDNKSPPDFFSTHIDFVEPLEIGELHVNPYDVNIIHDNKEHGMFSMVKYAIVTSYE